MRLILPLLALLVACGTDARTPSASADDGLEQAVPDGASWRAAAGDTSLRTRADEALARVDAARRPEVVSALNEVAAVGLGAGALRRAGAVANARSTAGNDPAWDGSGTAPGTAAVYAGSQAVLAGLVAASLEAAPDDAEDLLVAIDTMEVPPRYNSGGRVDDELFRQPIRSVLYFAIGREPFMAIRERHPGPLVGL